MYGDDSVIQYNECNTFTMSAILKKVFSLMSIGLIVSAISALIVLNSDSLMLFAMNNYMLLGIAEVILVLVLSAKLSTFSSRTCLTFFLIYSALNGASLSAIFLLYEINSIFQVFLITAGMFIGASLYGKSTKRDLTKIGSFLVMALIGVIIAGIIEIFILNDVFSFVLAVISVVLFVALTAYDVQKIMKIEEVSNDMQESEIEKVAIIGALQLYLDFINIFLKLLRILGKRRR